MLLVPPPDRRSYIRRPHSPVRHRVSRLVTDASTTIHTGTRRGWRWLVLFGMLYALLVGKLGLVNLVGLMHDTSRFNSEISRLKARCASLESDYRSYTTDPAAIEKVAREDLEFGKKGEIVFKFLPKK